jgi:hypothetical protein
VEGWTVEKPKCTLVKRQRSAAAWYSDIGIANGRRGGGVKSK